MKLWTAALAAVGMAGAIWLTGCGGGGGTTGGTTRMAVLATDSFRDDYDHVYSTIYKVELIATGGVPNIIFTSATGKVIDLKTLRDATGARFALLSEDNVPIGSYTGVRVTVGPNMTLFPKGSATGTSTPISDSVPKDGSGNPQIAFNFATAKTVTAASDSLVVDFDLANFVIAGGKITPAVKEGGKVGLGDQNRHEEEDYTGTISNLSGTAPAFTFNMSQEHGPALMITTDATTTIFNASSAPNPTLANGKKVEVQGKLNVTADQITVASIKIKDGTGGGGNDHDTPESKGSPSGIGTNTFSLTTTEVRHFVPANTVLNIVTNDTTVFRADSGVNLASADFYTRLAVTGVIVEVEGSYDAPSNTLTATRAKLEGNSDHGGGGGGDHEGEAKGTVTVPNATSGTFTLSPVNEYDGFTLVGNSLPIATTGTTQFKDGSGNSLNLSDFFAALTASTKVEINGNYASGTLTATKIKIKS